MGCCQERDNNNGKAREALQRAQVRTGNMSTLYIVKGCLVGKRPSYELLKIMTVLKEHETEAEKDRDRKRTKEKDRERERDRERTRKRATE